MSRTVTLSAATAQALEARLALSGHTEADPVIAEALQALASLEDGPLDAATDQAFREAYEAFNPATSASASSAEVRERLEARIRASRVAAE